MEIPHEVLAEEGIKTEWGIVPLADKEGLKMARSAANSEGNKGADYRYLALLTAPLKYVGNYFGNLTGSLMSNLRYNHSLHATTIYSNLFNKLQHS
ncbi:hypothetical protein TcasGA2_TC008306 [Tribolium castaneum]|uniref:Uncharacterized protein n=1 Tax=Tribolium castaneum TaxID=7070 RepID=D2A108_TRICA|nr:hypothetical protein TcasGA2_TC008306 [Tribolium castaneum]